MTIEEKNILIAEFMGYDGYMYPRELEYHTSWDWLMPVVEKIEKLGRGLLNKYFYPKGEHGRNDFLIFRVPERDDLHSEVVDFIQWYNQNK